MKKGDKGLDITLNDDELMEMVKREVNKEVSAKINRMIAPDYLEKEIRNSVLAIVNIKVTEMARKTVDSYDRERLINNIAKSLAEGLLDALVKENW